MTEVEVTTDCEKLKQSSLYVRQWASLQPAVKEESITDWLLYDISTKIDKINYREFSRHEEASDTGADWEWWFLFPTFSAKMRVQAKKLNPTKDNYPSIARTNRYGLQIEKLLHDSEYKDFVPFYAFYTSLSDLVMCKKEINDEGVFFVGGNRLYGDFIEVGKKTVDATEILKRSIPLSCFLCCPLCEHPEGFIRFLAEYFSHELGIQSITDIPISNTNRIRGIHREIPSYVTSFVENARQGLPEWWEREYAGYLEGARSLMVYDARNR